MAPTSIEVVDLNSNSPMMAVASAMPPHVEVEAVETGTAKKQLFPPPTTFAPTSPTPLASQQSAKDLARMEKIRIAFEEREKEAREADEAKSPNSPKPSPPPRAESSNKVDAAKARADEETSDAQAAEEAEIKAAKEAAVSAAALAQAEEETAAAKAAAEKEAAEAQAKLERVAAAEAEAKAESDKAKEAETAAKAQRAAEAAARREKMAKMEEEALVVMHLAEKIADDIANCEAEVTKQKEALNGNEASIDEMERTLADFRGEKSGELARQKERAASIDKVVASNMTFHSQCTQLAAEVGACIEHTAKVGSDVHTITDRVQAELNEAKGRHAIQSSKCVALTNELQQHEAQTAAAVSKSSMELFNRRSEVKAMELNLDVWSEQLIALQAKYNAACEANIDSQVLDAKQERMAQTTTQVEELIARIATDEETLATWRLREVELAADEKLAAAAAAIKEAALEEDLAAVRSLQKLQAAYAQRELDSILAKPDVGAPTQVKMLEKTASLLRTQMSEGKLALERMEAALTAHSDAVVSSAEERETELRLISTERQAMEVAHRERKAFLAEKEDQLRIEKEEVLKGREALLGDQHCIATLKAEVVIVEEMVEARRARAAEGREAEVTASQEHRQLKLEARVQEAAIKLRLDAEKAVEKGQKKYVDDLVTQLKREEERMAARDATLKVEEAFGVQAARESRGSLGSYLEVGAGQRGAAVVQESNEALQAWIAELKAEKEQCETELAISNHENEVIEKKAAVQLDLLRGQQVAINHALAKQEDYMANLNARRTMSPAKKIGTPLSRARSAKNLSLDPGSPASIVMSLPNTAEVSTPYAAAHKYLEHKYRELEEAHDDLYT